MIIKTDINVITIGNRKTKDIISRRWKRDRKRKPGYRPELIL